MPGKTSELILEVARDIVASDGLGGVSFDAIARRLGRSKQAVLYWYPSKRDLLAAMFLPWLEAETDAATAAVAETASRNEAIRAFIHAVVGFHSGDLDRFRMMYLVPQTTRKASHQPGDGLFVEQVHPVTDRLYDALAMRLGKEPEAARSEAVAIHSAVLGLVLMFALADALRDPLKHTDAAMVEALVDALTTR